MHRSKPASSGSRPYKSFLPAPQSSRRRLARPCKSVGILRENPYQKVGLSMRAPDKPSYEFGPFRLDAAEYVLMREDRVIPLSPKLFETLLVLVENSGHVVDKDELYKRVWQDVVVEETNLTKNISILRKILSEGDGEKSFIETVPKRGYRFVVPVRRCGYSDSESGSNPGASVDKKSAVLPFASRPHAAPTFGRETAARQPELQPAAEVDEPAGYSALKLATEPIGMRLARPALSGAYVLSQIKSHKHAFAGLLGIAVLLFAAVGFGLYKLAFQKNQPFLWRPLRSRVSQVRAESIKPRSQPTANGSSMSNTTVNSRAFGSNRLPSLGAPRR